MWVTKYVMMTLQKWASWWYLPFVWWNCLIRSFISRDEFPEQISAGSQSSRDIFNLKQFCKATNIESKAIQTFSKHNEFFKINCCKLGDICWVGFENGSANSLKQSLEAIGYNKSGLWRNHFGRMSVISTILKRNKILHCKFIEFYDLIWVPKTKY